MRVTDEQGNVFEVDESVLKPVVQLPPLLAQAWKQGLISEEEALLLAERQGLAPVIPIHKPQDVVPIIPIPKISPCTTHLGGIHIPVKHAVQEDGQVMGWCKCGYYGPAKCPHKIQQLRGRSVVCGMCNKVIYRGAGIQATVDNPRARGEFVPLTPEDTKGDL